VVEVSGLGVDQAATPPQKGPATPPQNDPATRPASGTRRRRFGGLDGLRALGALAVMGTHVGFDSGDALRGPFSGVLSRLDAGVALFFVISGFLLYRPHLVAMAEARPRPATGNYLWHRALRILPPLWIATVAAAFLLPQPSQVTLAWYLRHAALIQIYFPAHQVAGLTQMWSLATEGAFYVCLPLLAWFMSRRGFSNRWQVRRQLIVLGIFAVGGPLWKAVMASPDHLENGLWLPGYLGWFGAGMALAVPSAGPPGHRLVDTVPQAHPSQSASPDRGQAQQDRMTGLYSRIGHRENAKVGIPNQHGSAR